MNFSITIKNKKFNLHYRKNIISVNEHGFHFSRSFENKEEALFNIIKYLDRKLKENNDNKDLKG